MRTILITLILLNTIWGSLCAQTEELTEIAIEGANLFSSEMASWYGTDLALQKYPKLQEELGGYFSYTKGDAAICAFYSKEEQPAVICTVSFDADYRLDKAIIAADRRAFTPEEQILYGMRVVAQQAIKTDTLFKHYRNTNLNIIPLVRNNVRKVYVLTGPNVSGVVIFGNDYLLTFDEHNKLTGTKKLHKDIMVLKYSKVEDSATTMHTHLPETGPFITATDICTLRLYEKFAGWKEHVVVSQTDVSIWNCAHDILVGRPRKEWEKQGQNNEESH
ncbi:hypothetical protein [Chitinophaga pinensis]|uniref:Uncharacterized protein n=1 Tax=Chitinophaga pinensis TaxID=79329 RepID=A0A5C6LJM3_9BACT|nr:hypothetical protein [Chitinophaga pinensis]TWV93326.1 hypothetical protein FEF09_27260 [Chitinophaga pinensis]